MADTISTEFVLAILPSGKIGSKFPIAFFWVERVHLGCWGVFANLPPTTGCSIAIECYDRFSGCIKVDFSNVPVFWIFAFNGFFWYNGPAVVFCFCRFSHSMFCTLKTMSFDRTARALLFCWGCYCSESPDSRTQSDSRSDGDIIANSHSICQVDIIYYTNKISYWTR